MARVRYIVDDVAAVTEFYVSNLGFEVRMTAAPAINILGLGDLTLLVSGPRASASQPMLDGTVPKPGDNPCPNLLRIFSGSLLKLIGIF